MRLPRADATEQVPDQEQQVAMYRMMRLIRRFEERVNELYLQGKIPSTLHLYIGQEAVATGICANLRQSDYVLSTHRPHGHSLAKGVAPRAIMAELFGKVTGCCRAKGGSMHVGDISVGVPPAIAIVGGNLPIAAGLGLAAKMQGNGDVAVSFFGDGASNEGAWHEALNVAAVWDLPVIFVCENNLYAASTPFKTAFKVENVADRAVAYGMPGVIVDGNDVLAVERVSQEAIERARRGEGPTLIECKTYRLCGHSRSDPRTYRSREEEEEWKQRDAVPRFRQWLEDRAGVPAARLAEIEQAVEQEIDEAIEFAESSPEPDVSELYLDVFKE
ncbi:MAG: thiamine pyrophosphate-dependent dehydrogenase E1 component subunit alpha [Anaerolineales bacterium]|nr:thiamine pyrophosphate-dependent dehydrogenase E1 component subunit alpha [Anaerolineales bacterium]